MTQQYIHLRFVRQQRAFNATRREAGGKDVDTVNVNVCLLTQVTRRMWVPYQWASIDYEEVEVEDVELPPREVDHEGYVKPELDPRNAQLVNLVGFALSFS